MTTAAAILYRRWITALTRRCTFLFSVSMRKCFACMVFRTMREERRGSSILIVQLSSVQCVDPPDT